MNQIGLWPNVRRDDITRHVSAQGGRKSAVILRSLDFAFISARTDGFILTLKQIFGQLFRDCGLKQHLGFSPRHIRLRLIFAAASEEISHAESLV